MPSEKAGDGNGSSRVWWAELLRREGVLVALVATWIVFIAIPESRDRRDMLNKTITTMESISSAMVEIRASETIQVQAAIDTASFRRQVEMDHREQREDHHAIREVIGKFKPAG